jgi:hypothetical protein
MRTCGPEFAWASVAWRLTWRLTTTRDAEPTIGCLAINYKSLRCTEVALFIL